MHLLLLIVSFIALAVGQPKSTNDTKLTLPPPSVPVKKTYKEHFLTNKDETKYPDSSKLAKASLKTVEDAVMDIRMVSDKAGDIHEGRIEHYNRKDNEWYPVCADYWKKQKGDVACRQLGYIMGAEATFQTHVYGEPKVDDQAKYAMPTLECSGSELNLANCSSNTDIKCSGKSAGLKCYTQQGCPPGWTEFAGDCYMLTGLELNYEGAVTECKKQNATLARLTTAAQMSFISRFLSVNKTVDVPSAWIGAHLIEWQDKKTSLGWLDTGVSLEEVPTERLFWMPPEDHKEDEKQKPCVCVKNFFKRAGIAFLHSYHRSTEYWWANYGCGNKMRAICQKENIGRTKKPINAINTEYNYECYENDGKTYRGTHSKTEDNFICQNWPKEEIQKYEPFNITHNYCRNYGGEKKPYCYVNAAKKIKRFCSLPTCSLSHNFTTSATIDNYVTGYNKGNCPKDTFFCKSSGNVKVDRCLSKSMVCDGYADCGLGEDEHKIFCTDSMECDSKDFVCSKDQSCIDQTKICDGFNDCSDGADERNCKVDKTAIDRTSKVISMKGIVVPRAVIQNLTLEECVQKCTTLHTYYLYGFICEGVNYYKARKVSLSSCQLLGKAPEKSEIFTDKDSDLYTFINNYSTGNFNCKNGLKLPRDLLCNGVNNCGDGADEADCKALKSDYKTRLITQVNDLSLGRLEIHHLQDWGYVCINGFTMDSANVACKELGFDFAINFMTVQEAGLPYGNDKGLLQDVACKGSEKFLGDCPKSDFFKTSCTKREAVALQCSKKRECTNDEFKCTKSGKCINKSLVCNNVDDCGDRSDENHDCSIKVALEGDDKVGRLIIMKGPVNGTICSDSFDDNAAKVACRMLGFEKESKVIPSTEYGPGRGFIALDKVKCTGSENSLMACKHAEWGMTTCSHREDVSINCKAKKDKKGKEEPAKPAKTVECGVREIEQWDGTKMVEGGFLADDGGFPWLAKLVTNLGDLKCSGVILSEKWILTTASCFNGINDPKGNLLVVVGDLNSVEVNKDRQTFKIKEIHLHNKFNEKARYNNDLAMVKITPTNNENIKFNKKVKMTCIPADNEFPSDKCLVASWSDGNLLKMTPTEYMPSTQCKDYYGVIQDSMLCTESLAGLSNACKGDVGSPLVCLNQKKYKLYGVVSHQTGCGKSGYPSIYARPNTASAWIKSLIDE